MRVFRPLLAVFVVLLVIFSVSTPVLADDKDQQVQQLQQQISQLQQQLSAAKSQENTLKSQLSTIDDQTKLTQLKITQTQVEIEQLNSEITDLGGRMQRISSSVDSLSNVLLNRIVSTYKMGDVSTIALLFSSHGFSDLLERLKYIQVAQANDKKVLYQLQATKSTYQDQQSDKETREKQAETLKKQLDDYQTQLADQQKAKQALLTETQGDEATYEKLLSQAQAQLSAFQNFVSTQGGASLLSNQTVCDSWGCYYNQRDTLWGNAEINYSSGTTIAESGCLMTSMAMVISHYGHKVTPLDINISNNFFSSTAYLLYTISAGGVSASRARAAIDDTLNDSNHDPVIVGISYDGGPIPDHFVVLISGSDGNYQMNDPFTPNGHDINFTDHYSIGSIKEIDKVIVN